MKFVKSRYENKFMKTKKVAVDKNKCIGCGTCVGLAPEIFEIGADNKAQVKEQFVDDVEKVKLAVDACPAQAISAEFEE